MDYDTINNSRRYLLVESVIWKIDLSWQNYKKAALGHDILVISLYFLKYGNLRTKFPCEFSLCHYLEKVLNFDIFHRDNNQVMSSVLM